MSQITNLNIAPYYNDFDESDNFHRVLYRPSFAVQARELTTQQSILQDQIEKLGKNIFKEGAQVIPGEVGFTDEYYAVKLNSTFAGNDISSYISSYEDKIITGATSSASGTPSSSSSTVDSAVFASGYSTPELQPDSGDIIYIENRRPISRASDQTEDIKIIVEF